RGGPARSTMVVSRPVPVAADAEGTPRTDATIATEQTTAARADTRTERTGPRQARRGWSAACQASHQLVPGDGCLARHAALAVGASGPVGRAVDEQIWHRIGGVGLES